MAGPDTDLRKLSAEALKLVRAWAEDRLINAVTPLDIRLQLEPLTRNVPVADHGDPRRSRGEIPCQGGVLACPVGEGPHSHGACDLTCQKARRTVERILGIVDEVRKLAARKPDQSCPQITQITQISKGLQKAGETII